MKRILVCLMCVALLWSACPPAVGAHGDGAAGPIGILRLDLSNYYFPYSLDVGNNVSSTPKSAPAQSPRTGWRHDNWSLRKPFRYSVWENQGGFRLAPQKTDDGFTFNTRIRLNFDTSFTGGLRLTINPRNPRLPPIIPVCQRLRWSLWNENSPTHYVEPSWSTITPRISLVYDLKGDGTTVITPNWPRYYYPSFGQTDYGRLNKLHIDDFKWGSFTLNDGTYRYASELELGGPLIKDKLWFFGCMQCKPEKPEPQFTYGKLSDTLSISLEYNYRDILEAAAADPNINPFLAISNAVAEGEQITIIPNKIQF